MDQQNNKKQLALVSIIMPIAAMVVMFLLWWANIPYVFLVSVLLGPILAIAGLIMAIMATVKNPKKTLGIVGILLNIICFFSPSLSFYLIYLATSKTY